VDGFSDPASRCILKAADIAYVHNHTSVNAAHLILALSQDKRAALGMEDRGIDVEQLREAVIPLLVKARWKYFGPASESDLVMSTTSDVSNILEAARRKAGERDNQPATLPDMLDALRDLHAQGRLAPTPKGAPAQADLRPNLEALNGRLDEVKTLLEQGFRWNAAQLEEAMQRATEELKATLAKPVDPPLADAEPTQASAEPPRESLGWRRPFRLAILGLL
jgi:ATP-dependent Clp protease ATP-binding subunit ClpA